MFTPPKNYSQTDIPQEKNEQEMFDNDFEQSTTLTDSTFTLSEISSMAYASHSSLEKALSKHRCALDIGGTLAKLVYLSDIETNELKEIDYLTHNLPHKLDEAPFGEITEDEYHLYLEYNKRSTEDLQKRQNSLKRLRIPISEKQQLCFNYFHSQDVDLMIDFIIKNNLVSEGYDLNVTGGGAYKYSDTLTKNLKICLKKKDEMKSIMKGLSFSLTLCNSIFRYDIKDKIRIPITLADPIYPFLVINIGSGVSILKANSQDDFVRLTGTCVGGGTVLGLAKLIFGAQSFNEVAKLSESGSDELDLTVGDLFGDNLQSTHSLSLQTFASSFGKLFFMGKEFDEESYDKLTSKANIARSLIRMVSYNLGYLAYLVGTIHNVHRIFFAGKYIDNHAFTMECLTYGVNFYQSQYPIFNPKTKNLLESSVTATLCNSVNYTNYYNCQLEHPISSTNYENKTSESSFNTSTDSDTNNFLGPCKEFEVLFLKHDGYLGALGSLLS